MRLLLLVVAGIFACLPASVPAPCMTIPVPFSACACVDVWLCSSFEHSKKQQPRANRFLYFIYVLEKEFGHFMSDDDVTVMSFFIFAWSSVLRIYFIFIVLSVDKWKIHGHVSTFFHAFFVCRLLFLEVFEFTCDMCLCDAMRWLCTFDPINMSKPYSICHPLQTRDSATVRLLLPEIWFQLRKTLHDKLFPLFYWILAKTQNAVIVIMAKSSKTMSKYRS